MANTVNESVLCRAAPLNGDPTTLLKMVPGLCCLKGASPNVNHILGLGDSGFYSVGGMIPNHSIVDYFLEAVGMRLGFHFKGVEGEVSVGNNIVNAV